MANPSQQSRRSHNGNNHHQRSESASWGGRWKVDTVLAYLQWISVWRIIIHLLAKLRAAMKKKLRVLTLSKHKLINVIWKTSPWTDHNINGSTPRKISKSVWFATSEEFQNWGSHCEKHKRSVEFQFSWRKSCSRVH